MTFNEMIEDVVWSIVTIFFMALLRAPLGYALWNGLISPTIGSGTLGHLTLVNSAAFFFCLNLVCYFQLQKRDVIIANQLAENQETEEFDDFDEEE